MRGHQALIAMRRGGKHPATVFVGLDPDRLRCWRDWHLLGDSPSVEVEPGDTIGRLDLRFVRGLTVIADGNDAQRLAAFSSACMAAGAARVVASVLGEDRRGPIVINVTDTEGAWPS